MGIATQVTNHVVTKLKFPKLLTLFLALWILDMFIPDPIPFFDEIDWFAPRVAGRPLTTDPARGSSP